MRVEDPRAVSRSNAERRCDASALRRSLRGAHRTPRVACSRASRARLPSTDCQNDSSSLRSRRGLNCRSPPADCGVQPPDGAPAGRLRCASILTDRRAKMATLQVYDPFADTGFDELFRGFFRPVRTAEKTSPVPVRIDVAETDNAYTVQAEVPGDKNDD